MITKWFFSRSHSLSLDTNYFYDLMSKEFLFHFPKHRWKPDFSSEFLSQRISSLLIDHEQHKHVHMFLDPKLFVVLVDRDRKPTETKTKSINRSIDEQKEFTSNFCSVSGKLVCTRYFDIFVLNLSKEKISMKFFHVLHSFLTQFDVQLMKKRFVLQMKRMLQYFHKHREIPNDYRV